MKKANKDFSEKMIKICEHKLKLKGENVGISFYVFFKNKNDNPELLSQISQWWILEKKLDHFEKAKKIKELIKKDFLK